MRPIFRHHRPMKGYQPCSVRKIGEERSEVAVANKNLGMRLNDFQVDEFQQIVRSIASARANDSSDVFAQKHPLELAGPPVHLSGKIHILFEDGVEIKWPVTRSPQAITSFIQIDTIDIARGRHNADDVSGAKGRRL